MSEKRFTLTDWHEVKDNGKIMTVDEVVGKLNQQQTIIDHYKENWDDLVETSTKIALRNVELVEENAKLQKKIDWLCEVFGYGSDESMQKVKEWKRPKDGNV